MRVSLAILAILALLALMGLLFHGPETGAAPVLAQEDPVVRAYAALSPRQRVGQLFLVAFSRTDEDDPAADVIGLVGDYGAGGVVLQKGNLIFANERGRDLPREIAALTAELQRTALGPGGPGVPIFIAVDHEGDGDPTTHLREGFTAVPSAMAIGATWDPDRAEAIGRIVGTELAAVGVNLLLGPSLDVLAEPRVDSRGDIGTRSFGGDPYWVAQMGRAYIRGVHDGSAGRVATVAKHFPGHGGSDRLPDEEVATVNKSLSELRRIELPPFAAVTSSAPGDPSDPAITDALMTSHFRYKGFQGNIRRTTLPISIDPDALRAILQLNGFPFGGWHAAGGLIIADSLGVRAVRRLDDPSGETFRHRDAARKALEAGNDVLILAQFATTPAWSAQLANVQDVIGYFAAQYTTDAGFRARVDDAALRVLRRKAALYPDWSPATIAVDPAGASSVVGTNSSREVVTAASRAAVTRLRGDERPQAGQRIVIITDDSDQLACPDESCGLPAVRRDNLSSQGSTLVEALLLERYGPGGTGVVRPGDVSGLTFCQLKRALVPAPLQPAPPEAGPSPAPGEGPTVPAGEVCPAEPSPEAVLTQLAGSDWIVFAFADLKPLVVRDLTGFYLTQVNGLVQSTSTRVAVLSFGPPYYVDATNFTLLDAYIAAFSKIPTSIEASLESLFGDRAPAGASPVNILDADYDLAEVLAPDHDRPFALLEATDSAARRAATDDRLPARITVEVGPVLDRNGHPVPDDTEVELVAEPTGALAEGAVVRVRTVSGLARAQLTLQTGGRVAVSATRGGGDTGPPPVLVLPEPTPTPRPTPPPTVEAAPAATRHDPAEERAVLGPADLLMALASIVLVNGAAVASGWWRRRTLEEQLRTGLLVAAGGLACYLLYGGLGRLADPSIAKLFAPGIRDAAVLVVTAAGGLAGLAAGWWLSRRGWVR